MTMDVREVAGCWDNRPANSRLIKSVCMNGLAIVINLLRGTNIPVFHQLYGNRGTYISLGLTTLDLPSFTISSKIIRNKRKVIL